MNLLDKKATVFTTEKAKENAIILAKGELEGWTYKVVQLGKDCAVIYAYDKDGKIVGKF